MMNRVRKTHAGRLQINDNASHEIAFIVNGRFLLRVAMLKYQYRKNQ
jgi:hypothetical protein